MAKILDVKNTDLPCEQVFNYKGKTFILRFVWREYDDRIVCDLMDEFGNVIAEGEKLVFGMPIFYYLYKDKLGNYNQELPQCYIIPMSSNGQELEVNLENFSTKIFLMVEDLPNDT